MTPSVFSSVKLISIAATSRNAVLPANGGRSILNTASYNFGETMVSACRLQKPRRYELSNAVINRPLIKLESVSGRVDTP